MKKILFLLLITSIMISTPLMAEWIPLNKQYHSPSPPEVTLVSDDENGIVVKFDLFGFDLSDLTEGSKQFQVVDLFTESFINRPGDPELPYIAKVLAIPDQAGISVEILKTENLQVFNNIHLPPARESWIEGDPETDYLQNAKVYQSKKPFPAELAALDPPAIFRDFRIARVSVFPVRYIPAEGELHVYQSITIKINYGKGETANQKFVAQKPIAPSFGKLYRSFIFNYQNVLEKKYGGKENGYDLMLCIMPDAFTASFQIYADWKKLSGTDIHITKFSDIGANATNPDIIRNYIASTYYNWDIAPTYVLIVGDDGVFPKQMSGSYPNEDYFVEIDGDDYFPEMMIGRFTNESDYGLQVMINKFIKYEKTPYTTTTDWFKKGICCSNNAYVSQATTKRFAALRMLEDGTFTSVDTMMMPASGCPYNLTDVKNAINEGRSFLNYRGEGWSSGWWAGCYQFTTSHVTSLTNGQKFTFVTSIGCGVAMFHASGGNCFGEEWMEMGTLANPKGAAAFVGPTGNTHTTYNNKIDRGIYVGMFQEGMDTPGQALLRGKLYMYNSFGNEYYVGYHYRIFTVLGDPSIHIWKDVPKEVSVNYQSSIPFGNNTVEFTVTHTSTGQPVANAQVCVTGNNVFSTGYTDATGKAYLEIEATVIETFNVTVRGGNVIPFLGTLGVMQPAGPYIMKESFSINDGSGGNGNGLMDYGETNLLSITMKNVGAQQANNVIVTISTDCSYITITDNTANYGTIAPGSTAVVTDGFAYTVANNIPDLTHVSFEITATSGTESWISYALIVAHAPVLEYLNYSIADPSGNNNGKLDPGEIVSVIVNVKNSGSSGVFNVMGVLSENDPFITINTSQMSFGNIAGGISASAVYIVSAAGNTPSGHLANFSLALNADLGITGSGAFGIIVGQIPVLILDLDGNGNSSPAMEDALNTMDVSFEVHSSFPPNLNLYSTIFLCLGVFPGNHQVTSGESQLLVDYLNNGGSLYMEGADTWAYDPQRPIHAMFKINGVADGTGDMSTVVGMTGTFTEGMSFIYNGDNSWMDHIEPITPAYKIFNNQSPLYGTGIAYDAGTYKTIGTSHEFGGLQNGVSPSTKAELMTAYLEFFGMQVSLQAIFNSNVTQICENETVDFYDQSFGSIISREWTFEGGIPATSTLQNPTILYSTPGTFDVTLTISDGIETISLTINDYITVIEVLNAPPAPTGPEIVCANQQVSSFSTGGLTGISSYHWLLEPTGAGNVINLGLNAMVAWNSGFLGNVTLKVAGQNFCGPGIYSEPINITRYLPEVTLEPFDWVCIGWPEFELTGGMPAGGEYSGTGVENGWFYPAVAGVGTHAITYTYSDNGGCENTAIETILVDPCTGLNDNAEISQMLIYPNPGKGTFMLRLNQNSGKVNIKIYNSLNKLVFYENNIEPEQGSILTLDLKHLPDGLYYLHVSGNVSDQVGKLVIQQ